MATKTRSKKSPVENPKLPPRGRLYVSHLPFGFYDEALRKYYSQFGTVTSVRVERSKKTGGYKGYAFVDFESPEVAKIAAEASDNYIIGRKVLKASVLPPEEQHKKRLSRKPMFPMHKVPKQLANINRNAVLGQSRRSLEMKKRKYLKLHEKLSNFGIEFDEIPISLDSLEKRIEESSGRIERIKKLERELKEAKIMRKLNKLSRKREMALNEESDGSDSDGPQAPEDEYNPDEYKSKNAVDTFEKALETLKNQHGKPRESGEEETKTDKVFEELAADFNPEVVEESNQRVSDSKTRKTGKKKGESGPASERSPSSPKNKLNKKAKKRRLTDEQQTTPVPDISSTKTGNEKEADSEPSLKKSKTGKKPKSEVTPRSHSTDKASSSSNEPKKEDSPRVGRKLRPRNEQKEAAPRPKSVLPKGPMDAEEELPVLTKKQFSKKEALAKFKHGAKNIHYKYIS